STALAREERTVPERAAAAERLVTARHLPAWQALLEATRRDDPAPLQAAVESITSLADLYPYFGFWIVVLTTMIFSEPGLLLPQRLLDLLARHPVARSHDALHRCTGIAVALAGGDATRLAEAIEDAEVHGLIPYAARMRIVLAKRTGERTPLERARPVLE